MAYSNDAEKSLSPRQTDGAQITFSSNEIADIVYEIYTVKRAGGNLPQILGSTFFKIVIED